MSNNDWVNNLIKVGVGVTAGYAIYKGGKYLIGKAREQAEAEERQRMFEAQQQMLAKQRMLEGQRREREQIAQDLQNHYNLGLEKLSNGDFGGALHTFNKTLTILNKVGEPEGELASIYADIYRLISKAQLNLDDYQGAIASLNRSLSYNSDNAESYALRAVAKLHNNDLGGAKADIAIAVSLDPRDSRYQSIQNEISGAEFQKTNGQNKEEILRLHEKTVAAVASEFQEHGIKLVDIMSHIVREELILPMVVAAQLYVVSDIEIQLLPSITQMSDRLPKVFVAYWQFKRDNELLAVFDDIMTMLGNKSPQFQSEAIKNAVKSLHQKEKQILALPSFESQLVNLDGMNQIAYKQAYTVASSLAVNESQLDMLVTPVINFSKSVTHAFLQL